jgi:hypothetical protein
MSKVAKNEITGDFIKSKTQSEKYRENYDAIFRKANNDTDDNLQERGSNTEGSGCSEKSQEACS